MVRVISEPVGQLGRTEKAHLSHRQVAIGGLLIAAIFVGSIDIAMRAYSAIGTQPQTEKIVSGKIQDRLIAVVADSQTALQTSTSLGAVKTPQTSDPSASNPRSDVIGVFSVSNIHPTDGFVTTPATRPAASTRPNLAVSSTPVAQSQTAEEHHLVPVPTRKPKNLKSKEPPSSTAELKARAGRQEEEGPKPLAFGSIGYNYDPQR
jgi:hypothetical protein